ncbi:hypothetical protein BDV12DRAFT_163901, partial [Aspergillus spectabilis]
IGERNSVYRQEALLKAVDQACELLKSIRSTSRFFKHVAATAYLAGMNATTPHKRDTVRAYWENCKLGKLSVHPDGQGQCEEKWKADGLY